MAKTRKKPQKPTDSFEAVAKRLECDPNMATFDAKLKNVVSKTKSPKRATK